MGWCSTSGRTLIRLRAPRFKRRAGFRPTAHGIREMTRFGIVPEGADPAAVDPYATDRAYRWSFWPEPAPPARAAAPSAGSIAADP